MHPCPKSHRGFSLLEILVAFSIMALALGALYHASGGSLRGAAEVERQSRALVLAQSLLTLYSQHAMVPGLHQGELEEGRFRWRVTVEPYPLAPDSTPSVRVLRVAAWVEWDGYASPHGMSLATLVVRRGEILP